MTRPSPWPTSRFGHSRITSRARSQRWMWPQMRTPDAIRQRRVRRGRRLGLRSIQVETSEEAIELLEKRGYDPRRDKASIGQAVTALLSDRVLEAACPVGRPLLC